MIYVINGKPYVKVANYYKEVSVEIPFEVVAE